MISLSLNHVSSHPHLLEDSSQLKLGSEKHIFLSGNNLKAVKRFSTIALIRRSITLEDGERIEIGLYDEVK